MITYKTEQCQHCHGKGKVRFLLLFERDCPVCNGDGKIDVPQLTHEKDRKPFSVSVLRPETLEVIKKKPELLSCLSPNNRVDLLRKHNELRQPRPISHVESVAEKTGRRNQEMLIRKQFEDFMQSSHERQKDFVNRSMEWSREQHQQHMKWANEQWENFVNQNRF